MKYRILKKNIRSTLKNYKKVRAKAEKEFYILLKEFKEQYPSLSEEEVYKELKIHIAAIEKERNYAGARTVPMTVGVGILLFITNALVFDYQNEDSILYLINKFNSDLQGVLSFPFWIPIVLVVAIIIMFPVGLVIWLCLEFFTNSDRKVRQEIYKISIMNQIIEERIKERSY